MQRKESIGSSVRKDRKRLQPFAAGKSYQRYFDGYTIAEKNDFTQGAKEKYLYLYTGEYYCFDLPVQKRIAVKAVCVGLSIAALLLFLVSVFSYTGSNMIWYVTLPQALATPFLAWLVIAVFRLVRGVKMTSYEFRCISHSGTRAAGIAACLVAVEAGTSIVYVLLHPGCDYVAELLNFARFLVCAVLLYIIWKIENALPYRMEKNETTIPTGYTVVKRIQTDSEK